MLAILLIALASLVLGLARVGAAGNGQLVVAVLTAPALQSGFGVPLVIAHLLIFWYSQDSHVTPPVAFTALSAFAAALEGFLFSYLNVPLRLLATAGTVAIF